MSKKICIFLRIAIAVILLALGIFLALSLNGEMHQGDGLFPGSTLGSEGNTALPGETVLQTPDGTAPAGDFYVDPVGGNDENQGTSRENAFRTLERARQAVALVNQDMRKDIIVSLLGGTYYFEKTVTLTPADSGTNGYKIIYRAYGDEEPVFSGSTPVTGWTMYDAQKGIYKATLTAQGLRQLYVNGERAIRARTPNIEDEATGGPYRVIAARSDFFIFSGDITDPAGAEGTELVFNGHWSQNRCRIGSIDLSAAENVEGYGEAYPVTLQKQEQNSLYLKHHLNAKVLVYYLENNYEFLDAGGEWYFNPEESALYYKPREGEDIETLSVLAPVGAQTLVSLAGTFVKSVSDITFEGITFSDTDWTGPDLYGYIDLQAAMYINDMTFPAVGMVEMKNTSGITFERNVFQNGGMAAIMNKDSSKGNLYNGNRITAMAGGGIYVNNGTGVSDGDTITNNYVSRCGQVYRDAVGIFIGFPKNLTVSHNEVCDLPYTGISFGWDWTSNDRGLTNNNVSNNKIHGVMRLLDDGGAIYSLGVMEDTSITGNCIYDIKKSDYLGKKVDGGKVYPLAAIYLDNGSRYKTVRGNLIYDTTDPDGDVYLFFANNTPNQDNVLTGNYAQRNGLGGEDFRTLVAGTNECRDNIPLDADPDQWPEEATAILHDAGITQPYRDIIPQ